MAVSDETVVSQCHSSVSSLPAACLKASTICGSTTSAGAKWLITYQRPQRQGSKGMSLTLMRRVKAITTPSAGASPQLVLTLVMLFPGGVLP
ncbi:hypothetical protein FM111_03980 [Brevundimonas diminuta 3F5N]|uniref:Uncharacterized protein n=1 Tax=Brevundimonas diminuta 3F5N TaxID=1255603 RepID=A0A1R4FCR8_BREDI|nr:hypothetical protein FM111_03980 [Brevundimonas diminuta 3F5N]